jgi:hypothetical protein
MRTLIGDFTEKGEGFYENRGFEIFAAACGTVPDYGKGFHRNH